LSKSRQEQFPLACRPKRGAHGIWFSCRCHQKMRLLCKGGAEGIRSISKRAKANCLEDQGVLRRDRLKGDHRLVRAGHTYHKIQSDVRGIRPERQAHSLGDLHILDLIDLADVTRPSRSGDFIRCEITLRIRPAAIFARLGAGPKIKQFIVCMKRQPDGRSPIGQASKERFARGHVAAESRSYHPGLRNRARSR
jgi:hypothetical protein